MATQQADAAAEAIATRAGADVDPRPFRPVLRGMLLTGATPRYLRADVSGGDSSSAYDQAPWWLPSKIAEPWLAPSLALGHVFEDKPACLYERLARTEQADLLVFGHTH